MLHVNCMPVFYSGNQAGSILARVSVSEAINGILTFFCVIVAALLLCIHVAKHTKGLNGLCKQMHPLSSDVYLYTQSGPPTGQPTGQWWRNWGTINSKWGFYSTALAMDDGQKQQRAATPSCCFLGFPVCFMICIHKQMQALVNVCLSFWSWGFPKCWC